MRAIIFLLFVFSINNLFGQNCIFNDAWINGDFLEEVDDLKYCYWDSRIKEGRGIRKNGNFVHIKKWACNTYGIDCKEIIINPGVPISKKSFWLPILIDLGKDFLSSSNFEIMDNFLRELNDDQINFLGDRKLYINIDHPTYPEFLVSVMGDSELMEISISYYMN
ncbi:MAG: hypothetical protein RIM99_15640 [Cyclobacteriaceae bacterium]